jgi:hypothetical protein
MPMVPTLRRAANGARILETVANYGRAELKTSPPQRRDGSLYFVADDDFRQQALHGAPLGMNVEIPTQYHSPAELRLAEELLQRCIADVMLGNNVTGVLLGVLSGLSEGELRKISSEMGILPATWFRGKAAVHEAQHLIAAVPPAKTAALIDAIRSLQPDLIPM